MLARLSSACECAEVVVVASRAVIVSVTARKDVLTHRHEGQFVCGTVVGFL